MKRSYDSTVARIAGNLASGLMNSSIDIPQHQAFVARVAVHIARLIVAETMRTEPVPADAVDPSAAHSGTPTPRANS